jgi:hypothetical protein
VDKETNERKLEQVLSLLTELSSELAEPAVTYSSARKGKGGILDNSDQGGLKDSVAASERQFAEGKGIPLEQFEQEMDAMLEEIFADGSIESSAVPKKPSTLRTKRKRS